MELKIDTEKGVTTSELKALGVCILRDVKTIHSHKIKRPIMEGGWDYMKQKGVTDEESFEKFLKNIRDDSKDFYKKRWEGYKQYLKEMQEYYENIDQATQEIEVWSKVMGI